MTLLAARWGEGSWRLYADRRLHEPDGKITVGNKARVSTKLKAVFAGDLRAINRAWTEIRRHTRRFDPDSIEFDKKGDFEAFVSDDKRCWYVSNSGAVELFKEEGWMFLGTGAAWAEGYVMAVEEEGERAGPREIYAAVSVMNHTCGSTYDEI